MILKVDCSRHCSHCCCAPD